MSKHPRIYLPAPACEGREGVPLYLTSIAAGWPSPAEDYIEGTLDLHEHLVHNPPATFFLRVTGDSMKGAGIHEGDLLVVDRSIEAVPDSIVIAAVDGELTVKRLDVKNKKVRLMPENPEYPAIDVTHNENFEIWGVVIHSVHSFRHGPRKG